MKKFFLIPMLFIMALFNAGAHERITQDQNVLPAQAKEFLNTHFPQEKVSYIKIEKESFRSNQYEVKFTSGTEIEFNHKGEWLDVDCKRSQVPIEIIPNYIQLVVQEKFPGNPVTQIKRDRTGYEVELANKLELIFNKKGKLIKIED